jgi:hypothetical protein
MFKCQLVFQPVSLLWLARILVQISFRLAEILQVLLDNPMINFSDRQNISISFQRMLYPFPEIDVRHCRRRCQNVIAANISHLPCFRMTLFSHLGIRCPNVFDFGGRFSEVVESRNV